MNTYKRIIKFVIPFWKHIFVAVICSFFFSLLHGLSVYLSIPLLDTLFQQSSPANETADKSRIEETSSLVPDWINNLINDVSDTFHNFIDIVREIVLWHELGHWITHWMPGKNGHRWDTRSYDYNYSTKDVHEGLAQAFTLYAIINIEDNHLRNEYQQVFHYILRNQAPCYHKHYDIINHENFNWKRMLNGISMLRIIEKPGGVTFDYLLKNMF